MLGIRTFAILFGIVFIAVGIAGFLPMFTTDNMLLGLFMVDPMHNWVHIASGIVAFLAATKIGYAKLFFQVFGIVYGLVAILGFVWNGDLILMQVNMADNFLHAAIAVVSLYLGFIFRSA
jgi:hypothetical protein